MYEVAHYLRESVLSGAAVPYVDEFARTTFNRYYYAAFHKTKEMVDIVAPEKATMAHKAVLEFLRGSFLSEVERRLKRGWKTKTLSGREYNELKGQATHAAHELAQLLETANSTRVIADYQLSVRIQIRAGGYSLGGTDVKEAARWHIGAGNHCEPLKKVWSEING